MQDYWRFTPRGLRTLLERAGLTVDSVGSWGNRRVIAGNLDRWPAYRRWHSLRNEPDAPGSGVGVRAQSRLIEQQAAVHCGARSTPRSGSARTGAAAARR